MASAAAPNPHCIFSTLTRVKYAATHLHNSRYPDLYYYQQTIRCPLLCITRENKAKSSLDRMRRVSEQRAGDGGLPYRVMCLLLIKQGQHMHL